MDLLKNPFYILSATPRDDRREIMQLAEERSLLLDANECARARTDLLNPRKRLSSEIAWLPGLSPKRAAEVLSVLENSPPDLLKMDNLPDITKANLLAAGLSRLSAGMPDNNVDLIDWILELAWAFEDIDPDELCSLVNEDRIVSRFQEVTDLSMIEAEIQERRSYYKHAVDSALDKLSSKKMVEVVTAVVESATDNGEEQGPGLIDDLVDSYTLKVKSPLEEGIQRIRVIADKIKAEADEDQLDANLAKMVNELIRVVNLWDFGAQPIQLSAKSRGLDHEESHQVAGVVRGLAVYLFNEHGKLEFSQQLNNAIQKAFAEVAEVAERSAEDASTLEGLAEKRRLNDFITPILRTCNSAVENTDKDPTCGEMEAKLVMDVVPALLTVMSSEGVPDEIISKARDEIAITLMHCAISFGNETNRWEPCRRILEEALKYVWSKEFKDKIKENLSIVNENCGHERQTQFSWATNQKTQREPSNKTPKGTLDNHHSIPKIVNHLYKFWYLYLIAMVIILPAIMEDKTSSQYKSEPYVQDRSASESSNQSSYSDPPSPSSSPKSENDFIPVTYTRPSTAPNGKPWPKTEDYVPGYKKLHTKGLSRVTIDNSQCNSDVFVKLVSLDGTNAYPVRVFFIPAYKQFTVNKITAGKYEIRYRDLNSGHLSRSEPFQLEEIPVDDAIQFSNYTMTLYKVLNGNMQTYDLSEEEF